MKRIKFNLHLWNNHLFLGFSFVVFAMITSIYWGLTYAEGITSSNSLYNTDLLTVNTSGIVTTSLVITAPVSLTPGTITSSSVSLKWVDRSTNEDRFIIEKMISYAPGGTTSITNLSYWTLVKSINANITSYEDTSVVPGAIYNYRIRACLGTSCSDNFVLEKVAVPAKSTISTSCLDLNFKLNDSKTSYTVGDLINYTWVCSSGSSDTGIYLLLQKNDETITTISQGYVNTQTSNLNTSNLSPGSYIMKVCQDSNCTSGATSSQSFSLSAKQTVVETPKDPTGLSIYGGITLTSTYKFIPLKWNDNSTNEDHFIIERRIKNSTASIVNNWNVIESNISSNLSYYSDQNINAGTIYDYRVKACLHDLCSKYSVYEGASIPISAEVLDLPVAPIAPTGLTYDAVVPGSSSITLRWKDNSTNEKLFIIKRKLNSDTEFSKILNYTTSNVNYYVDKSYLEAGVYYDYSISACVTETICSSPLEIKKVIIPIKQTIPIEKPAITETKPIEKPTVTNSASDNTSAPTSSKTVATTVTQVLNAVNTEAPAKIENLGLAIEEIKISVSNTKNILISVVNDNTLNIIKNIEDSGKKVDTNKINSYKDELINKIEASLLNLTSITPQDIEKLNNDVNNGIEVIKKMAGESVVSNGVNIVNIKDTIGQLSGVVSNQKDILKKAGADLVYKDTNKDGISDYDSIHIYNIDPIKSSPVSILDGKKINASEKIILGFDPSKKDLVKIKVEQPIESKATIISTYKIENVGYDTNNKVVLKGQALPNSFITVYIYSTPIMVTIKTDSTGEWKYVLDKELEDGNHTIYTASVNNSGNIIAKSTAYSFVKTAEAVSLQEIPVAEASSVVEKPGIISGKNIFMIIIALFMMVGIILILIGVFTKKNVIIEDNI